MSSEVAITSYIGRADELRLAHASRQVAAAGAGTLLMVTGEAGIGKTRFCEEVTAQARQAGMPTAWGRCWSEGGAPPLWPWHAVIDELCGPGAAAVLEGDAGSDQVDPERFARFAAVLDALRERCRDTPSVAVIDDVQAADAGAVLLTRFVARSLHNLPLLLLVTRRDGEPEPGSLVARLLSELAREARSLPLHGLDADEAMAFMNARGLDPADDERMAPLLHLTAGNPLFLGEVLSAGPLDQLPSVLPDGVRKAIDERLARLDERTRHTLGLAALLGSEPSVAEIAALCEVEPAAVVEGATRAAAAGVIAFEGHDRIVFRHDLLRDGLVGALSAHDRLEGHARAAGLIATSEGGVDAAARRAHHACAAAVRSVEDARTAVAASRDAARSMVEGFSYEQGASVLATAIEIRSRAGLTDPCAELLVERAETVLACGRLAEARLFFDEAAAQSVREDDTVSLARAAIGLGGVWVNEHRAPDDQARVQAWQERAWQDLGPDQPALRVRLEARLAAEARYRWGPLEPVHDAVVSARAIGDGQALAEALSLWHHSLLAPEYAGRRLPVADEMIAAASRAGAGLLVLVGLCWRTVDLYLLGDPRAGRALEDFRLRADALQSQSLLYMVSVLDVMRLIRAGRFDEAEFAVEQAYQHGLDVGEADAVAYYGAHLTSIRWAQGRSGEILPFVEAIVSAPTIAMGDEVFPAAVAGVAAAAGDGARARAALDQVTALGLRAIPRTSTWLTTMLSITEAAYALGDVEVATEVYELLTPFASLPVMPSLAVTCLGSVERLLGLAAATMRRGDDAIAHLERATRENRRLGNQPLVAITQADLADCLLARAGGRDLDRAARLLDEAIETGTAMGLDGRVDRWRLQRRELADPRPEAPSLPEDSPRTARTRQTDRPARTARTRRTDGAAGEGADPAPAAEHRPGDDGRFRAVSGHWEVAANGRQAIVADSIGMRHLRRLLGQPGVAFSAAELAGGGQSVVAVSDQPLLDDRARAEYRRRVTELTDELAEAEQFADLDRESRLRLELDALVDELERATALGGRPRTFAAPSERARTSVRKAIKRAVDRIGLQDPDLGSLLEQSLTTGTWCRYDPAPGAPTRWVID